MIKPLSVPEIQLLMVRVRNMELFIVPLKGNGNIRYEVNLFLMTSIGPLTSMLILEAQEKPADWVTWAYCFQKIINSNEPHDVCWFTHQLCENSFHNQLFCSALMQSSWMTKQKRIHSEKREILLENAINYISLF